MKSFLILTPEGTTTAPNPNVLVENLQLLGIVEGVNNQDEAIVQLLKDNPWIFDAEYNVAEFVVYEVV
jgi:hypothetical protein